MSGPERTSEPPRTTPTYQGPERILPTEPGWWWCQPYFGCQPEIREVWLSSREGRGLVFYREVDGTSDESERVGHDDGVTWLCRVPAPEQLAAQAVMLAAGQALADQLRVVAQALCANHVFGQRWAAFLAAFLAAFPPAEKGGAR